ncbi:hypothetical protein FQZ97_927850 [compost metagenome]
MERADEIVGMAEVGVDQQAPAVLADVVERLDALVTLAHDDDRLVTELVFEPIAGLGDIGGKSGAGPGFRPHPAPFLFGERWIVITLSSQNQVIVFLGVECLQRW